MGILKKFVFFAVIILFAVSLSNCSKNTYSSNYHAKSRGTSPTLNPVSPKDAPVRKHYIVPAKKKKVLGQEKPKI